MEFRAGSLRRVRLRRDYCFPAIVLNGARHPSASIVLQSKAEGSETSVPQPLPPSQLTPRHTGDTRHPWWGGGERAHPSTNHSQPLGDPFPLSRGRGGRGEGQSTTPSIVVPGAPGTHAFFVFPDSDRGPRGRAGRPLSPSPVAEGWGEGQPPTPFTHPNTRRQHPL